MADNCREKILSQDYWDFIIPLYRDEELQEVDSENVCIQEMILDIKVCLSTVVYWQIFPSGSIGTVRFQNVMRF